jgi:hypothetical protein
MLAPHPAVIFTPLNDGEAVLLHMDSKLYYSLNGSGSFMWQLLESKAAGSEALLVKRLCETFQIPLETAQADVREFVGDLVREGLLQETNP